MNSLTARFSIRLLAVVALALLGACAKKDAPAPAVTTEMSWTADNTKYTSTTATATVQGTKVTLDGTATSGSDSYSVSLAVPAMVGTYSTAGASNAVNYSMFYFIKGSAASVLYMASNGGNIGSGTVTISTFSATNISGTFSFTGFTLTSGMDKAITNGRFSIDR